MKSILTSDIHLSSYSNDKIDKITKLPERLSSIVTTFINLILYAIMNGITNIIIIGDIFHNKSIIHSIAQSILLDIIRKYKEINFIILDGNHDMSSMTGDGVSATKCLDNEPNVRTIHETTMIENMLFVPWNPVNMQQDIKLGNADYLFSHLGLNEGKLNSGISIVSDVGLKDLKQYKKVYLGHYHSPQSIGNVTYVGSLIQLDWGEKNEDKRFIVFDNETGEEQSILSDGYKKHFEFNLTNENKDEIIKFSEDFKKAGHYVTVNMKEEVDVSDFSKDINIVDKREKDITNRGITSEMSNADKLERYMGIKEIPADKREKYKNVALDVIEKTMC